MQSCSVENFNPFPIRLGRDFSGIVVDKGMEAKEFDVGDQVHFLGLDPSVESRAPKAKNESAEILLDQGCPHYSSGRVTHNFPFWRNGKMLFGYSSSNTMDQFWVNSMKYVLVKITFNPQFSTVLCPPIEFCILQVV